MLWDLPLLNRVQTCMKFGLMALLDRCLDQAEPFGGVVRGLTRRQIEVGHKWSPAGGIGTDKSADEPRHFDLSDTLG